jgi:hypothetical protein
MLKKITAKQFRLWEMYYELEPFGEIRDDYRIATIVQALCNINRSKGQPVVKLEECVLKLGEAEEKPKQTAQQQLAMLRILAAMHATTTEVPTVTEGNRSAQEQMAIDAAKKAMN